MNKNITEEIRDYARSKDTVSLQEIVNYILVEKGICTTEEYIYQTLLKVLLEQGKTLKRNKLVDYVREYVKAHNGSVYFEEVLEYIRKKKIKTTEKTARLTLYRVLKETDGRLKCQGVAQLVRDYLKTAENSSLDGAYQFVLTKNNQATFSAVKAAWYKYR